MKALQLHCRLSIRVLEFATHHASRLSEVA